MSEDTARYRPLRPGAQISLQTGGGSQDVGTIGCFVQPVIKWITDAQKADDQVGSWKNIGPPCLLTCYHVVKPSSNKPQPVDEFVHQPFAIGFEHLVGKYYVGEWSGSIDAALCRLGDRALDSGLPKNEILGGGGKILWIIDVDTMPYPRNLQKYGRSTGMTQGMCGFSTDENSDYEGVRLSNLFTVVPTGTNTAFCDDGDSGAAIVDGKGGLVGFVHVKFDDNNRICAKACRATEVFKRLAELVKEKEDANYADDSKYPNRSYELKLIF